MGCSDSACSVTGTCIGYRTNSRAAILIVEPVFLKYGSLSNSLYKPRSLFIRGQYNDYGGVFPDKGQDFADEAIQRFVGCSLYDSNVWLKIRDKTTKSEKRFGLVLVHEAVLDYIVSVTSFDAPDVVKPKIQEALHKLKTQQKTTDASVFYEATKELENKLVTILNEYCLSCAWKGDYLNQVEEILSIKDDLYSGERIANWCLDPERLTKLQEVGAFYAFFEDVLSRKVAPATRYQDQHIDLDIEEEKIKAQIGLLAVAKSIFEQQKTYFEEYVDD